MVLAPFTREASIEVCCVYCIAVWSGQFPKDVVHVPLGDNAFLIITLDIIYGVFGCQLVHLTAAVCLLLHPSSNNGICIIAVQCTCTQDFHLTLG